MVGRDVGGVGVGGVRFGGMHVFTHAEIITGASGRNGFVSLTERVPIFQSGFPVLFPLPVNEEEDSEGEDEDDDDGEHYAYNGAYIKLLHSRSVRQYIRSVLFLTEFSTIPRFTTAM